MDLVFYTYLLPAFLCIAVAYAVTEARTFSIGRRCRKLEIRVGDIEDRQLSVRGKEAAKARWNDKTLLDGVLAAKGSEATDVRFDNDPRY